MSESLKGIFENVPKENLESRERALELSELKKKYKLDEVVGVLDKKVRELGGVTAIERGDRLQLSDQSALKELLEIQDLVTEALKKIDAYMAEYENMIAAKLHRGAPKPDQESVVVAQREQVKIKLEEVKDRIRQHNEMNQIPDMSK